MEIGLVAAEERFFRPPANPAGIRVRLQLAPKLPACVNASPSPPRSSWLG